MLMKLIFMISDFCLWCETEHREEISDCSHYTIQFNDVVRSGVSNWFVLSMVQAYGKQILNYPWFQKNCLEQWKTIKHRR